MSKNGGIQRIVFSEMPFNLQHIYFCLNHLAQNSDAREKTGKTPNVPAFPRIRCTYTCTKREPASSPKREPVYLDPHSIACRVFHPSAHFAEGNTENSILASQNHAIL
jgi:hypothetical protein